MENRDLDLIILCKSIAFSFLFILFLEYFRFPFKIFEISLVRIAIL